MLPAVAMVALVLCVCVIAIQRPKPQHDRRSASDVRAYESYDTQQQEAAGLPAPSATTAPAQGQPEGQRLLADDNL
jgi:hypothetical protein